MINFGENSVVLRAIETGEPINTALEVDEPIGWTLAATPTPEVCSKSVTVNGSIPCFDNALAIANAIGCESRDSMLNA
ncbi:unannotated protein [freshwater metagenome]|uniref:Unannotated protein n=1 Tax=freshwater metagenome TaxID=449393 RepID=A0A6J7TWN6_9ZZZZ